MNVPTAWVPYGRPAAEALRAEVRRAKGDEPLAPVTVVVPSNHVGVATRRLLGLGHTRPGVPTRGTAWPRCRSSPSTASPSCSGPPGWPREGRRPVSTPVMAAALRAALADDPGVFAPVASHPATETALVAAYRELRDVSTDALDALARRGGRAPPTSSACTAPPGPPRAGVVRRGGPDRRRHATAPRRSRRRRRSAPSSSTCPSACRATVPRCSAPWPTRPAGGGRRDHRRRPGRRRGRDVGPPPRRTTAMRTPGGRRTRWPWWTPPARGSSPRPTPTRRCAPPSAPSSTPSAAAPRSTASPSSTPAPSPTPAWSTSS